MLPPHIQGILAIIMYIHMYSLCIYYTYTYYAYTYDIKCDSSETVSWQSGAKDYHRSTLHNKSHTTDCEGKLQQVAASAQARSNREGSRNRVSVAVQGGQQWGFKARAWASL